MFIHFAFFLAMRRFFGFGLWSAVAATAGFLLVSLGIEQAARPLIGGSAGYLPGLLAIAGIAAALWWRHDASWQPLAGAFLIFFVSLSWRTVDGAVCGAFPLGTHFLWHVLNACVLYVLSRTLMVHAGKPQR